MNDVSAIVERTTEAGVERTAEVGVLVSKMLLDIFVCFVSDSRSRVCKCMNDLQRPVCHNMRYSVGMFQFSVSSERRRKERGSCLPQTSG